MKSITWTKIKQNTTSIGYRKVISKTFKMPDGSIDIYDVIDGGTSVCVLALTRENKVILTEQYRPGPEIILHELPGGTVDEGESNLDAIKREMLEETGYTGEFIYLGKTYRSAYSTGIKHFFITKNCNKQNEVGPGEFINPVLYNMQDFHDLVIRGELTDLDGALLALKYLQDNPDFLNIAIE